MAIAAMLLRPNAARGALRISAMIAGRAIGARNRTTDDGQGGTMICPATYVVNGKTYHCQRELCMMRGGQIPAPHIHHSWSRKIGIATLTLSWDAVSPTARRDVEGER